MVRRRFSYSMPLGTLTARPGECRELTRHSRKNLEGTAALDNCSWRPGWLPVVVLDLMFSGNGYGPGSIQAGCGGQAQSGAGARGHAPEKTA